jgi:hypothetical protein
MVAARPVGDRGDRRPCGRLLPARLRAGRRSGRHPHVPRTPGSDASRRPGVPGATGIGRAGRSHAGRSCGRTDRGRAASAPDPADLARTRRRVFRDLHRGSGHRHDRCRRPPPGSIPGRPARDPRSRCGRARPVRAALAAPLGSDPDRRRPISSAICTDACPNLRCRRGSCRGRPTTAVAQRSRPRGCRTSTEPCGAGRRGAAPAGATVSAPAGRG